jgi:hypothetical protein
MNVFRHDDIPQYHEPVMSAHPIENFQEQIRVSVVSEKGAAPVATESQKVLFVTAVKPVQTFRHEWRVEKREGSVCDD